MSNQPAPPAPGPEADPTMSGPAEAERRAQAAMDKKALEQQLEMMGAHDEALIENQRREQEDDNQRHKKAIEDRITSSNVQALNDRAMFKVYGSEVPVTRKVEKDKPTRRNLEDGKEVFEKGSKGVRDTAPKKHKDVKGKASYTVIDPSTGEVIGSPERPLKGKLDEIRNNPIYGKTMAERKKAAKAYEEDLLSLVEDEGLELSQAKLIMDLREKDREKQIQLAAKLEIGGTSRSEAAKKAKKVYKDKDSERLDIIKTEGAFTEVEYAYVRQGGDLYSNNQLGSDDDKTSTKEMDQDEDLDSREAFYIEDPDDVINRGRYRLKNATDLDEKKKIRDDVVQAKRAKNAMTSDKLKFLKQYNRDGRELLHDLGNALNDYASLQARFEAESPSYGDKKREKARQELEEARQQYEILRRKANNRIGTFLKDNGLSNEEVTEKLLGQDAGRFARPSHGVHSGGKKEVSRGEAGLVRDVTRQEIEQQMKNSRRKKESRFVKGWMKFRKKERKTDNDEVHLDTDDLRYTKRITNKRHLDQLKRIGDIEGMIKSSRENENKIYQAREVTSAHFDDATATKPTKRQPNRLKRNLKS